MKKRIHVFKIICLATCLCIAFIGRAQQGFVNNGAHIIVTNGATLYIAGSNANYTNQANGTVQVNGLLNVAGNWNNNSVSNNSFTGSGTVLLNGTTTQTIGGTSSTPFYNLNINNSSGVGLMKNAKVFDTLNFVTGKISLISSDLFVGGIKNASSNNYVVANGNGKLKQTVASTNVLFPVGTLTDYLPVTISNSGVKDTFGISLFQNVTIDGTSTGAAIATLENNVKTTWNINEGIAGGSNLNINFQWNATNEGALFTRANSAVMNLVGSNWTALQTYSSATGTNPYSRSINNVTSTGAFSISTTTNVTIAGNAGVAGATLSYFDGTAKTATADGSGNYSFTVSYNWNGTVTPSKTNFVFTPTSKTYSNLTTNLPSENYTAKQNQTIIFTPFTTPVIFGSGTFNLTATSSSGLTVTFVSTNTLVATILGNTVTIVGVGATVIKAQQAGNGSYNAATDVPLTLTVNKATPVITWSNPVNITYGTALSATQLNATASVPGTFVYSPILGTVLNAGNGQTLSVTFTPTDGTVYNSTSANVLINVSKATLNVIADNISNMTGIPIPALTYHFNGFVNNDLSTVVSGTPILSTTAIQSSPIGTYPITITQGSLSASNYNFNFVNGIFTVITNATTWNGTSWSNGTPVAGISAIINATYTVGVSLPATNLTVLNLTIASGVVLYVKQGFSLTVNGNFSNNGGIVLQGDATATPTGSFICYGTSTGTGTYTAQRNFAASGIQHFVSSPMPNQSNTIFASYYSFQTGNGTTWTPYTGVLASTTGYAVQYTTNNKLVTFAGSQPFYSGNQQVGINGANVMFLAGNPYPSAIDWVKVAGLAQTNITNTFYIRDVGRNVTCNTTTCASGVFATDRFIPAMKGFLVKTSSAATGTFVLNNTVQTNSTTAYWKDVSTVANFLRLKTTGGDYQGDEAVIYFDENASTAIDNDDADKLFESEIYYTHLFSLSSDNQPLAINVTPTIKTLPLVFKCGVAGNYGIAATELRMENNNTVYLEDIETGTITDLSTGAFIFKYDVVNINKNFVLHFGMATSVNNITPELNATVYSYQHCIYVKTNQVTSNVIIYNLQGVEIVNRNITSNFVRIDLNVASGVYLVKVISNNKIITQKVLIE